MRAVALKTPTAQEFKTLRQETAMLRSALVSFLGQDPEGAYQPAFVREALRAAQDNPVFSFSDQRSFLSLLEKL